MPETLTTEISPLTQVPTIKARIVINHPLRLDDSETEQLERFKTELAGILKDFPDVEIDVRRTNLLTLSAEKE